ncbi:hypothetical protein D3C80_1963600 [compost metagenome]
MNMPSAPSRLLMPISRPATMIAGRIGMNTSENTRTRRCMALPLDAPWLLTSPMLAALSPVSWRKAA